MMPPKDNRKDKVLILGSEGQLGKSLEEALKNQFSIESVNKRKFDFLNPKKISDLLSHKTKYVINVAAYTDVEQAEIDINLAELINGEALKAISQACYEKKIKLFHFSSDYVFDGKKDQPYSEEDVPNPISIYGKSKLLGEKLIQENTEDFLIFRTSGIISKNPNNFIYKIISASEIQDELKIVSDQKTSLNFSGFLADAVLKIINLIEVKEEDNLKGVFNLVGPSYGSWYEFAKFAQELSELKGINSKFSKINIVPVSTDEMNFKAQRPRFSHLSSDKLKKVLSLSLPNWKKSIEAILN